MITEKNQVASFLVSTRVYYSPTDRSTCVMRRKLSHLALSNKLNDEVEALKAKAAKLRQEADSATQALGKDIKTTPKTKPSSVSLPKSKVSSMSDVLQSLKPINFLDDSADKQCQTLDNLLQQGEVRLWKSAVVTEDNTVAPLLRTYPVSLEFLSSRTGGKLTGETLGVSGGTGEVSLDDIKDATIAVTLGASALAVASLTLLPENIGATVCYFIALVPIGFVAIGSTAPGLITGLLSQMKGTADSVETKARRICAHEAGHFLCGYLCGLPIKRYTVDEKTGYPCVEFHPSSFQGSDQREFTKEEIAALAVVALSGSVAEVLTFGRATGGESDLMELDRLFRRSEEFIGTQKQQDLTRWGAYTAYNLIKANMGKYEKLVESFSMKKSISECIATIETCE